MRKIVTVTAVAGGRPETPEQRQARIDAAMRRCVSPIGDEEARLWDAEVNRRAKAA